MAAVGPGEKPRLVAFQGRKGAGGLWKVALVVELKGRGVHQLKTVEVDDAGANGMAFQFSLNEALIRSGELLAKLVCWVGSFGGNFSHSEPLSGESS